MQTARQSRETGATITQLYPGAEHRFSDSARQDKPVNADTSRLYWPQALAFIDLTTA